jgi:ferredoxin
MKKTQILIDNERCDFCGTCVAVCPEDAIELTESTIHVVEERCSLCESCIEICPLGIPEVME